MSGRQGFDAKLVGETATVQFNFLARLAVGETISTAAVAASVYSGVDGSPSAIISGSASASGAIVSQNVTAGVAGVIYELTCTVTTSAGQTLQLVGLLPVTNELP